MANADTDRNDLQREIGALTARVERAGAGASSTPAPPSPSSAPTSP